MIAEASAGSLWEKLLYTPPMWIVALLLALLVIHGLDKILHLISTESGPSRRILVIVEIFVTVILGYIALHLYWEHTISAQPDEDHASVKQWFNEPIAIVVLMVGFGVVSLILYLISQYLERRR